MEDDGRGMTCVRSVESRPLASSCSISVVDTLLLLETEWVEPEPDAELASKNSLGRGCRFFEAPVGLIRPRDDATAARAAWAISGRRLDVSYSSGERILLLDVSSAKSDMAIEARLRVREGELEEVEELESDCFMPRRAFAGDAGAETRRVRVSLGVAGRSIDSLSVSEPE
jgi:hypothetical protein